jgi:sugar (glycoside-pentoside-hexuronide) transporter
MEKLYADPGDEIADSRNVCAEDFVTTMGMVRLDTRGKLGYGAGDLGQTLFFQATLLYLIYFYTDVAGIAPAAVGTILLIARSIDAFVNPLIGMLADRTRTRWGRFRPYLLFGAIPLALTAFATFSTVPGSEASKQAFAIVSYAAFSICFATVAIPYSALLSTITSDPRDRTALGTLRAGFSFSAGIIVSFATLPLVNLFGGGNAGFHLAIAVFGVIGVALVWITFATTKELVSPSRKDSPKLSEMVRCLGTAPIMIFVAMFLLTNISTMLRSAGAIYFFKYTLGRAELVSAYLTFGAVMTVVGIAVTPFIGRWIGKRGAMIAGLVLMAVGYIMASIIPASITSTFVWLGFFVYFGYGLKAATTWPILADCVDYAEWRRGKRVDGVAYGFAILAQKLSLALGGVITDAELHRLCRERAANRIVFTRHSCVGRLHACGVYGDRGGSRHTLSTHCGSRRPDQCRSAVAQGKRRAGNDLTMIQGPQ